MDIQEQIYSTLRKDSSFGKVKIWQSIPRNIGERPKRNIERIIQNIPEIKQGNLERIILVIIGF